MVVDTDLRAHEQRARKGAAVAHFLLPVSTKPSPFGVNVVSMSLGELPRASVTHSAAMSSVLTSARSASR